MRIQFLSDHTPEADVRMLARDIAVTECIAPQWGSGAVSAAGADGRFQNVEFVPSHGIFHLLESGIMLKSQDVVIASVLALRPHKAWNFKDLGESSGLSQSATFRGIQRLRAAGLVVHDGFRVFDDRFLNFLEHGVPYVFPAAPGKLARGIPTAHAAPPLSAHISSNQAVVWPDAKGSLRGESVTPLVRTVPAAARRDERLYQVLALIDALRIGRPREQKLAAKLLKEILAHARLIPEAS